MPFGVDLRERLLELLAAVAAQRVEDVAGEALRVDAHEHVLGAVDVAAHERDVRLAGQLLAERDGGELAVLGRQAHRRAALDELLVATAVLDQVGDRDHLQPVPLAVRDEIGHARHRPVVVHHLADDTGRSQTGEARQVDGRLGLADPLEHAAGLGAQREDVTRLHEIAVRRVGVDRDLDRPAAVGGGDPGRDTLARLDRHGEGGAERRLVVVGHRAQAEVIGALLGEAEAHEAARVRRHEVDRLGRRELRGDDQVALVLAVGVVDDDHEAPFADVLDRLLDGRERSGHCHGRRLASEQLLDVLGEHVRLQVDAVARLELAEGRLPERVRDQRDGEPVVVEGRDRQARALDGDGALLDHVPHQLGRRVDPDPPAVSLRLDGPDLADAVDVTLDVVAAERLAGPERGLDVDPRPRLEGLQRGARERLGDGVEGEAPVAALDHRQADAAQSDRVAEPGVGGRSRARRS